MAVAIIWRSPYNEGIRRLQGESEVPRTTDAREKAIETAERLFRVQGYAATGLTQIIEESGSPKGSFYFHFPGGKRELATEVIAAYRARTAAGFRALANRTSGEAARFVRSLARSIAHEMSSSGWTVGCVAQTLSQELAPADAGIADELARLFEEWAEVIAAAVGPSDDPAAARARALALIAGLEGARTLARTLRSAAPFDAVAAQFSATAMEGG
jgi:TetR/AcrR family transcriptional repressor of lmrAB and yxaGH operons